MSRLSTSKTYTTTYEKNGEQQKAALSFEQKFQMFVLRDHKNNILAKGANIAAIREQVNIGPLVELEQTEAVPA